MHFGDWLHHDLRTVSACATLMVGSFVVLQWLGRWVDRRLTGAAALGDDLGTGVPAQDQAA